MKISIKYKRDGYSYPQKNLDTDMMYAWNGHTYIAFYNWKEIFECMSVNSPIVVLSKNVGSSASMDDIVKYMLFVINPSAIAIVFPVKQGEEVTEKKETKFDKRQKAKERLEQYLEAEECLNESLEDDSIELSDLVTKYGDGDYVGSTNKDGITS